ncbi:MAG TPA: hypothetical protein VIG06_15910 [Kofleriaceae bacterium]|jgi:hypothetical protein
MEERRTRIEAPGVRSLVWRGDELVDWVRGGDAWSLDGTYRSAGRGWGYQPLDAAIAWRDWAFVYHRCGTSGLLLKDGAIVRQLHRSLYHADAYEYPVCLGPSPGGRALLIHCPDSYDRIEIDDLETGARLTAGAERAPRDFFHSRLAISPGGARLVSAGWVWQPWDAVLWFDLEAALGDPTVLDRMDGSPELSRNVCLAEESGAAWLDDRRLLLVGSAEGEDPEEAAETDREHPGPRLRPCGLAVYDVEVKNYVAAAVGSGPLGTVMPLGTGHVVAFHRHPRVIALDSGEVVREWPDLSSGTQVSSILWGAALPPLALDRERRRFALADDEAIHVVEILA